MDLLLEQQQSQQQQEQQSEGAVVVVVEDDDDDVVDDTVEPSTSSTTSTTPTTPTTTTTTTTTTTVPQIYQLLQNPDTSMDTIRIYLQHYPKHIVPFPTYNNDTILSYTIKLCIYLHKQQQQESNDTTNGGNGGSLFQNDEEGNYMNELLLHYLSILKVICKVLLSSSSRYSTNAVVSATVSAAVAAAVGVNSTTTTTLDLENQMMFINNNNNNNSTTTTTATTSTTATSTCTIFHLIATPYANRTNDANDNNENNEDITEDEEDDIELYKILSNAVLDIILQYYTPLPLPLPPPPLASNTSQNNNIINSILFVRTTPTTNGNTINQDTVIVGELPIHIAIRNQNYKLVRKLLDHMINTIQKQHQQQQQQYSTVSSSSSIPILVLDDYYSQLDYYDYSSTATTTTTTTTTSSSSNYVSYRRIPLLQYTIMYAPNAKLLSQICHYFPKAASIGYYNYDNDDEHTTTRNNNNNNNNNRKMYDNQDYVQLPIMTALEYHLPCSQINGLLSFYPDAVTIPNIDGNVPLHVAVLNFHTTPNQYNMYELLLDYSYDAIITPNHNQQLPIHCVLDYSSYNNCNNNNSTDDNTNNTRSDTYNPENEPTLQTIQMLCNHEQVYNSNKNKYNNMNVNIDTSKYNESDRYSIMTTTSTSTTPMSTPVRKGSTPSTPSTTISLTVSISPSSLSSSVYTSTTPSSSPHSMYTTNNNNNDYSIIHNNNNSSSPTASIVPTILSSSSSSSSSSSESESVQDATSSINSFKEDSFVDINLCQGSVLLYKDCYGEIPLHIACRKITIYSYEILQYFIQCIPQSIQYTNDYGHLPIHLLAAGQDHYNGSIPDNEDSSQRTTILEQCFDLIYNSYPDGIYIQDDEGDVPIHCLLMHHQIQPNLLHCFLNSMKKHMKDDVPIDSKNNQNIDYRRSRINQLMMNPKTGHLPLHTACMNMIYNDTIFDPIIQFDPYALLHYDHDGYLPFHIALLSPHHCTIAILKKLLYHNHNPCTSNLELSLSGSSSTATTTIPCTANGTPALFIACENVDETYDSKNDMENDCRTLDVIRFLVESSPELFTARRL